jgi:hypothetical protein
MQRQKPRFIAKMLVAGALMMPLVSNGSECSSGKDIVKEIAFNANYNRDTLKGKTEKDTALAQIFNVARNRLSKVAINEIEAIEGYYMVETREVFSDRDFRRMIRYSASGDGLFYSNISEKMREISFENSDRKWGVFLTENGMGIRYDGLKEHLIGLNLCKGNRLLNFISSLNRDRTSAYYSKLSQYDYSWISLSCRMMDSMEVPSQYLILAFTNLYPSTPKEELRVVAASLKLPETWKVTYSDNFFGISCCDAFSPSAYFTAQDRNRNSYEILMLGNSLIDDQSPRQSVLVFIKDNGTGTVFEVK